MANKKLPGGRKSAGGVSTSALKLVSMKAGTAGIAISELPPTENLTGKELFPVVQDKETRGATVEQIKKLIPAGDTGASAYEVWATAQPEGADKSEAAYLEYMKGKPGKDGENGADGLSAYQIWVASQESGADTTEQAYLAFQEGKQGVDGENGASAYDLWVKVQPEGADTSEDAFIVFMSGKPGKDGENGTDGLSAYQIWADAQEGSSDTSEAAYLQSMEGKQGDNGLSAYQIWLNAGNEGTEDDFLEWLKVSASVDIDPLATNLVKANAAGLYVNGAHAVIPKFSSSTLTGLLDTYKSMADGTRVYTMTVSLSNPLKVTSVGGVSISRYIAMEPAYFYTDEKNEYINAQYFISATETTASAIKTTISVIMPARPYNSWNLSTLAQVASAEDGDLQCKVSMRMLVGTTLSQNGMS
ncbi:hypothetical protein A6J71_10505 [Enterobacter cancerogenus]|uniref:hypothetical protein n=1 Tax=Enterobacter cancerogenus TaxID=69218 RepID=UPI000C9B62AD|nr:hypothetical protein [Enterobacter cancerogenus]PNF10556.1 hypothetical protein A6J71_10505 [Enterobacter cancerogenus]